jgi:hypothetical protein
MSKTSDGPGCLGPGGRCRYFIIAFYGTIYVYFILSYVLECYPVLPVLYPESYQIRRFLSFFVLPWPWLIVALLQVLDPGSITSRNVESYLKIYPYDNLLYERHFCRTLKIPVVARSRYCQHTQKRIARYDHFCPWVMAPIGARSHRFFLAFLLTNIIASSYLASGELKLLKHTLTIHAIPWGSTFTDNMLMGLDCILWAEPNIAANFAVLVVIAAFLSAFLIQQIYYQSLNRTQIELDKIQDIEEGLGRRAADQKGKKYRHAYDRGFVGNWKELLFPSTAASHRRMDYSAEIAEENRRIKAEQEEKAAREKTE